MPVTLIASERFYYNGRNVEMGEEFEAEDKDVALLTHTHTPKATTLEVTPHKDELGRTDKPVSETQGTRAKSRVRYRTRDMKAED